MRGSRVQMFNEWTCHICKETRPDNKISVRERILLMGGVNIGQQNIRYCNDRKDCIEKSKTFSHIKLETTK